MRAPNDEVIVAGLDGSAPARAAADWAGDDAARRGATLRLVHATPLPPTSGGHHQLPPTSGGRHQLPPTSGGHHQAAHGPASSNALVMLNDAAEEIARRHPGLVVEIMSIQGRPADVLLGESRRSQLLVVGSEGESAADDRTLGAVAARVAARSEGCVVVHHWHRTQPTDTASTGSQRPGVVIVGLDGSAPSDRALGVAFEEASLRGARLVAVHAWNDKPLERALARLPLEVDAGVVDDSEREILTQQIQGWSDKYPEVVVEPVVVRGRPASSLLRLCGSDGIVVPLILVVGSRGRGALAGRLLGSTSKAIVENASCTVAIVH